MCAVAPMFFRMRARMLASMSEIDPRVEMPLVDWSEADVSGLLPTRTVTLLLADVDVVRLVSEGLANTTSPQGFSSHRAQCIPTSPTSTSNWA
jgi:hypothetical protein